MSLTPRAVLFDLDGTLFDTAPDLASALNALRREEQLSPLPFEDIRVLVSHGAAALVRFAFAGATESLLARLDHRFLELYAERVAVDTRLYEGLASALARLDARGIPWGVVTNKPRRFTEPLLERFSLLDKARVVVSGDTLPQRKPHPAPLLYAARAMRIDPTECIFIGDAERDVLAARAANMRAYVAMFGYISATDRPLEWLADEWLDTPAALVAQLDSVAGSTE